MQTKSLYLSVKLIHLTIFFLASVNTIDAQSFCGVIKYRHTYYKGKNEKDVTATVKDIKTEDFYICGNKFKTFFDGKLSEIMIGDSSAYFFVVSDSVMGYIKANAAYRQRSPEYSAVKKCIYKNQEYKCVEEKLKKETLTYYFNDDVRIDPDQFSNIELYHWNKFFKVTNGSLRLVAVSRRKSQIRVSEVVELIKMSPELIDFSVPPAYKIETREGFRVYN